MGKRNDIFKKKYNEIEGLIMNTNLKNSIRFNNNTYITPPEGVERSNCAVLSELLFLCSDKDLI